MGEWKEKEEKEFAPSFLGDKSSELFQFAKCVHAGGACDEG